MSSVGSSEEVVSRAHACSGSIGSLYQNGPLLGTQTLSRALDIAFRRKTSCASPDIHSRLPGGETTTVMRNLVKDNG
jgi:hypothetical protein